uniref:Uncharacterized protein n=1 Tax=Anguilla anguilla TaxID=7936 RepID=A0A0E9R9C4_ANGAN
MTKSIFEPVIIEHSLCSR